MEQVQIDSINAIEWVPVSKVEERVADICNNFNEEIDKLKIKSVSISYFTPSMLTTVNKI